MYASHDFLTRRTGETEHYPAPSFLLYQEIIFQLAKRILRWPYRAFIDCVYFTLGKH